MYIFPLNWVVVKKISSTSWVGMCNRVLSRFFVQAGHETMHLAQYAKARCYPKKKMDGF